MSYFSCSLTVKVLNPAFYGGSQPNPSKPPTIDKQKKSTTKINTTETKKEIPEQKKPEKTTKIVPKTNNIISNNSNSQYKEEVSYLRGKKKTEQFEKEKKPIPKKNFLDSFEGRYKKFIELVNPLVGIRGKRMNITELKAMYKVMFTEYPDVVNVAQASEMLGGISEKTVYSLLKRGIIKSLYVGKRYLIPKAFILEYLLLDQKQEAGA